MANGVTCYQRVISELIPTEKLDAAFAYVDSVEVRWNTKEVHDNNLGELLGVAKKYNTAFNGNEKGIRISQVPVLGYGIYRGSIRPDPDRLQPLRPQI